MKCSCETQPAATAPARRTPERRRTAAATSPFAERFPTPEYPPREWFDGPPDWVEDWRRQAGVGPDRDAGGILRLTVTDQGQVGGWFYEKGQCIVHQQDACPGPSPTRYAAFMQNDIVTDDGQTLQVGVIGNVNGHASPWLSWQDAQKKYADPDCQMILCRAGDDERGGWIAGALVPGLTYGDVAMIRRCGLSGDWRPMPESWWREHGITAAVVEEAEGYDCIGPTLVTRPALPLVKSFAASAGARAAAILGGAAGVQLAPSRRRRPAQPKSDPEWLTRIAARVAARVAAPGNADALIQWYVDGADGAIDWGEHGAFDACVAIAGDHVDDPEAFCATRHHDATGEWPGAKKAAVAAADESVSARLRALSQELAVGQRKTGFKPGPLMSPLLSAAALLDRGDTEKATKRLGDAVEIAREAEDAHPGVAGLGDRIQAMLDEQTGPQAAVDWLAGICAPFDIIRSAALARTAEWDESMHPRGEGGKFGESDNGPKEKDQGGEKATQFVEHGGPITLKVGEIATFTRELGKMTEPGKTYNLCEVSVPGSNIFCGDNQGIGREEMPQFKGNALNPDVAEAFGVDANGEVDVTQGFLDSLRSQGVKMDEEIVPAASLKATQMELRGEKVAGMVESAHGEGPRPGYDPTKEPIVVSSDNYVVDGHHRWAAAVALDADNAKLGDGYPMPVIRVDMPIADLIPAAKDYADQYVAPKSGTAAVASWAAALTGARSIRVDL